MTRRISPQEEERVKNLIVAGLALLTVGILGYCFRWEIARGINELLFNSAWGPGRITFNLVTLVSAISGIGGVILAGSNAHKLNEL